MIALAAAPSASAILGCGINPVCMVGKVAGGGISSLAGDAITALAKAVLGALGHAIEWASTLWVGVGTPQVADASGQATGTVVVPAAEPAGLHDRPGGPLDPDWRRPDRLARAQVRSRPRARPVPGHLRARRRRRRVRRERPDRRRRPDGRLVHQPGRRPAATSPTIWRRSSASHGRRATPGRSASPPASPPLPPPRSSRSSSGSSPSSDRSCRSCSCSSAAGCSSSSSERCR